jgi:hypothetical protein
VKQLVPTEWNLHTVTSEFARACTVLVRQGQMALVKRLVEDALDRVNKHPVDFASRSFASVGAFIDLGKLVYACFGADRALPWFERALRVPGASKFRAQVVDALIEVGAHDEALVQVARLPKSDQLQATAKVHFAARRWAQLQRTLTRLNSPNEAARLAWGFWRALEYPTCFLELTVERHRH